MTREFTWFISGISLALSRCDEHGIPHVLTEAVRDMFCQIKGDRHPTPRGGLRIVMQTSDDELPRLDDDPHDLWSLLQRRARHDPTLQAAVTEAGTLGRHQAALLACLRLSKQAENLRDQNVRLLRNQPARIEVDVQGQKITDP